MKASEAIEILEGLRDNAEELGQDAEKYETALSIALYEMTQSFVKTDLLRTMEELLRDMLGEEKYNEFSEQVAITAYRRQVERMPEGEFKDFCREHMEEITGESWHEIRMS